MLAQTLLVGASLCFVLAAASAVVARGAARDARSQLRDLWRNMEQLNADHAALLIRAKRIEGRQTARIGRDGDKKPDDGLPDPVTNPDAWRAAVRARGAFGPPPRKELS